MPHDTALAAAPEGHARAGRSPWLIAPVVALAAFMEVLDISIANVALNHIAGSMSASEDESTWILTSYLIANAIVLPISGWLSEVVGRKRFFMLCIAGFTLSSLLCGLAPNLGLLVLFRAIQGATGGGLQPVSQAILVDSFPQEKRGTAFVFYALATVFAPAIGPTLGGWITEQASWRWVFLINLPVGIALLLLVNLMVQDSAAAIATRAKRLAAGLKVDYLGFGMLVVGLGSLQLLLDKGQREDWLNSHFIQLLALASVAALVAFVVRELKTDDPIVDLKLLKNRNFAMANAFIVVLGFVLLGSTQLLPEFVQNLLGYSATDAGRVISPAGFMLFLILPIVGKLSGKIDTRWLLMFGFGLSSLGLLTMTTHLDQYVDYRTIALLRAVQMAGLPFLFIPINVAAYVGIPAEKNNMATSIINLSRNLGGSVGIAILQTLLARRVQYHQSVLTENAGAFNERASGALDGLTAHFQSLGVGLNDALQQAQAALYGMVQQQSALLAYIDCFWVMGISFLLMLPFVLLLKKGTGANPMAH